MSATVVASQDMAVEVVRFVALEDIPYIGPVVVGTVVHGPSVLLVELVVVVVAVVIVIIAVGRTAELEKIEGRGGSSEVGLVARVVFVVIGWG